MGERVEVSAPPPTVTLGAVPPGGVASLVEKLTPTKGSALISWLHRPLNDCAFLAFSVEATVLNGAAAGSSFTPPGCRNVDLTRAYCVATDLTPGLSYSLTVRVLCTNSDHSSAPSEASTLIVGASSTDVKPLSTEVVELLVGAVESMDTAKVEEALKNMDADQQVEAIATMAAAMSSGSASGADAAALGELMLGTLETSLKGGAQSGEGVQRVATALGAVVKSAASNSAAIGRASNILDACVDAAAAAGGVTPEVSAAVLGGTAAVASAAGDLEPAEAAAASQQALDLVSKLGRAALLSNPDAAQAVGGLQISALDAEGKGAVLSLAQAAPGVANVALPGLEVPVSALGDAGGRRLQDADCQSLAVAQTEWRGVNPLSYVKSSPVPAGAQIKVVELLRCGVAQAKGRELAAPLVLTLALPGAHSAEVDPSLARCAHFRSDPLAGQGWSTELMEVQAVASKTKTMTYNRHIKTWFR